MNWDLSCKDWEQRLRDGRSLVPDLPLNVQEGERAVAVLNKLRLADVTGTPSFGDAGGEWFRQIVRAMFGSYDPVTKSRAIRELFLLVPKKHSKTTNGALLMLTALLLNERPRAPFMLTAPFQKTADEAFSAISGAIALDPVLDAKLHVRDHLKMIVHRQTGARLEILTFDPAVVTGKKVVGALIDELHVLGKMARADKALLQLRGGMQPFPEAFLAIITTQSDEAPSGVFKDDLTRARAVRDGKREGAMLPVLYEFPEAMQRDKSKPWRDVANWPMVSPNLGRSISLDRLEAAFKDESEKGEGQLRLWASQHLNIEIGMALHSDRWAGADHWEKRGDKSLTLESVIARSDVIQIGIDGGGLDDMLGVCVLGRDMYTGKWLAWFRAWVHEIVLRERRQAEAPRFRDFAAQGDLIIIPDDSEQDIADVADIARQVVMSGLLDKVGVDPVGIGAIVDALIDETCGVDQDKIVGIKQGYSLMGPIKTAERKLAAGSLVHSDSPLLAWCVGNCKAEPKGNAIIITKQASGFAKIDPVMALFDASALMSLAPAQNVIGADYELTTA